MVSNNKAKKPKILILATLASGCASSVTYRVGEGMIGALSALIGLAAAATLTVMGFLKLIKDYLQTSKKLWLLKQIQLWQIYWVYLCNFSLSSGNYSGTRLDRHCP